MFKHICEPQKYIDGVKHDEHQYINVLGQIMSEGSLDKGRNGFTYSTFGVGMHFDLSDSKIPIFTSKKLAWKTCLKELLWFISGSTNNEDLVKENVKIWNENSSREFLDSIGLYSRPEGDLGPVYGHQLRHFNAPYTSCSESYKGKGVDQLQYVIDTLLNPETRTSRRMVISMWNPEQLHEMALPPCHLLCQFNVTKGNLLSCSLTQRSGDMGLGVPFNIASYSFLTHLVAHHCGLIPHEFAYFLGNAHVYEEHILPLKVQMKNTCFPFPTLTISQKRDDIGKYTWKDFEINGYQSHQGIKMDMIP